MSITLTNLSLAGVTVGQTGTYDFSAVLAQQALPLTTQMNQMSNAGTLVLFNESGSGLQLTFLDSQHQINLPAGAWRRIPITAADHGFKWVVSYQINNPLATILLIDYYRPGELIDEVGSLGNSPIGGSITTTTTQQLYASDNLHYLSGFWDNVGLNFRLRPNTPGLLQTGIALQYMDNLGVGHDTLILDDTGNASFNGSIVRYNSTNVAAGTLGVPFLPGATIRQHITGITLTTVLTYTPPSTGIFRLSGYLFLNNGTSGNVLTFRVNFTNPDRGSAVNLNLWSINGSVSQAFNGSGSFANGDYPLAPYLFAATGGAAITVSYQDPTNTPSDFVTLILEQVA